MPLNIKFHELSFTTVGGGAVLLSPDLLVIRVLSCVLTIMPIYYNPLQIPPTPACCQITGEETFTTIKDIEIKNITLSSRKSTTVPTNREFSQT